MTPTHNPPAKGLVNDILVRVAVGLQQGNLKSRSDANEGAATKEGAPLTCKAAMVVLFDQYFWVRHKNKQGKLVSLVASDGISSRSAKEALWEEFLGMLKPLHSEVRNAHNHEKLFRPTGHDRGGVQVDPWPASLEAQGLFLKNLEHLIARLEKLDGDLELDEIQSIIAELFGKPYTENACKELNITMGAAIHKGKVSHETGTGQPIIPAVGVAAPALVNPPAIPRHTFHGEKWS